MSRSCRATICAALVALILAVLVGTAQENRRPILVLVSFDGWRWDYLERANAPNLRALASKGVRAKGLIPSFPSVTFPNHYTIVTGLYPEHHGIVANNMADPAFPQLFTMTSATARDGRWWQGEPIWVTASRQGQRTASMFWPGSEADIAGVRPTYWKPFHDEVPNADRVNQVLEWLALPSDQQPSFVTLYFSEVDHAGHDYGPDSPQVMTAASHLDDALGQLMSGVERLGLSDRLNVVVVSDHGMAPLSESRTILLDDYIDLSTVDVVDWTPVLAVRPKSTSIGEVYRMLNGRHRALKVYKRESMPEHLHYRDNPRIQPIIGVADSGWTITSRSRLAADRAAGRMRWGGHGYDPRDKTMHGLFVAAGPKMRSHAVVPEFENVHIYDFLCDILGITPARNDGNPAKARELLSHASFH